MATDSLADRSASPAEIVRPLVRTRQYREFTDDVPTPDELAAIADAGRWSGSSQNSQPWRFVVIRDPATLDAIAAAGLPSTRGLRGAHAAIAVAMPINESRQISLAYDEARATERMLVAASMLGLGAGISWLSPDARRVAAERLGLPEDRQIRTIVQVGHPTAAARAPKSEPGTARLPRAKTVYEERWPAS
ncbi:MAG TPA: nitroreductase family protein [Candidatus Limnocylindrales bacterium]|nr:nitroreductase family protein [Candidatus Limnocylindrales bacterium]